MLSRKDEGEILLFFFFFFFMQVYNQFQTFVYQRKTLCQILGTVFLSRSMIYKAYVNSDIIFTLIPFTYIKRKGILWLDATRVPVWWSLWSSNRCFVAASHSLKPPFHASVLFRLVSEHLERHSGEGFILIQMTSSNLAQQLHASGGTCRWAIAAFRIELHFNSI